jgi:hypothetical protein
MHVMFCLSASFDQTARHDWLNLAGGNIGANGSFEWPCIGMPHVPVQGL